MLSSSGVAGSQTQHIKLNAKQLSVELRFAAWSESYSGDSWETRRVRRSPAMLGAVEPATMKSVSNGRTVPIRVINVS